MPCRAHLATENLSLSDDRRQKWKSIAAKLGGLIKRTSSSSSNDSSSRPSPHKQNSDRPLEAKASPGIWETYKSTFFYVSPSIITSHPSRSGSSPHSQVSMSSRQPCSESSPRSSPSRSSPSRSTSNINIEQGAAYSSRSSIGFSPQTLIHMRVDTALRFALMATNMPLIHAVLPRKTLDCRFSLLGARFSNLTSKTTPKLLDSILDKSSRRLYVLVRGGLLRYDRDIEDDSATPEGIYMLTTRTICCVTDVIPGLKWVLELSKPKAEMKPVPDIRSMSSCFIKRSSSQSPTGKCDNESSNPWYLVAPNADSLSKWLFAIKSQIAELRINKTPSPPRFITAGEAFAVQDESARIRAERSTSPTVASSRRQHSDSRSPHTLRSVKESSILADKPHVSFDALSVCDKDSLNSIRSNFDQTSSWKGAPHTYQWSQNTITQSADVPRRPPQPTIDEFDSYDAHQDGFSHQSDQGDVFPSRRSSEISSTFNASRRTSSGTAEIQIRFIPPASLRTSQTIASTALHSNDFASSPPMPAPKRPIPPIPSAFV